MTASSPITTLFVVSGGDAPGINTLLAHYTRLAGASGDRVLGAFGGFPGLLAGQVRPLTAADLLPWLGRAGSVLPTSRDPVLTQPDAADRVRAALTTHAADALILFGGNGTLRHIPPLLAEWGVRWIGIPTTIDNDVPGTEETLGFDSACNFACQSIDGLLATAHALPGRTFLVETLGGTCGNLALAIGHAAGADAVIVPEYVYDDDWLAERVKRAAEQRGHALIVIGEGARGARTLSDELPARTGIRVRDIRLGHAQRGGTPSHRDRALAAGMARLAYQSLRAGAKEGILVVRGGRLSLLHGALPAGPVLPDRVLYETINTAPV